VRERDWCHDRVEKQLPTRLAAFARHVGRNDAWMSLAWLVYGPGTPTAAAGVVVIGEPKREKGRLRVPVCGPGGLRFLQVLQRDRAHFRRAAAIERGTRLPPPPPDMVGDTWHLGPDNDSVLPEQSERVDEGPP
jgi:hypothetical protein